MDVSLKLVTVPTEARSIASLGEKPRVNATLAIKTTIKKIAEYDPRLFEHLSSTVRTGVYCSHTPDRRAPIRWD